MLSAEKSRFAVRRRGYCRELRGENHFAHSLRRRNRSSLAIFFAEKIAHLGALLGSSANRGRRRR